MAFVDEILTHLDAQCGDYQAMYREGLQQRDCLRNDDLPGLNTATQRMRGLMDRVQLRQRELPPDLTKLERSQPAVAERTESMRQLIHAILEVREQSESAAQALLDNTQDELRSFDTGRRATRQYQPTRVNEARFIDGRR